MTKKSSLFLFGVGALFSVSAFLVAFNGDAVFLIGSSGIQDATGTFSTGGNAGRISFDDTPTTYSGAQVITSSNSTDVYLTGIFWIGNVGWATFSDVGGGPVKVVPPPSGASIRDPWYLSGYIWSDNAGWINLNHGETYASGVWFFPDSTSLSGYAWSESLGWIPFEGTSLSVGAGFIGKNTIGGGIGGKKSFNTLYSPGSSIAAVTLGGFLNDVRRNVAIISRNAQGNGKVNTNFALSSAISFNKTIFYRKNTNPSLEFLKYSTIQGSFDNPTDKSLSLIVVGGDIYIDTDVISPSYIASPRTLIALQNDLGQGGNIYIKGSVKKIEATLVTEKTIWSGEEFLAGTLSPYIVNKESIFSLPQTQLYILGLLASNNTIGGAGKDGGAVCPTFMPSGQTCTYDTALPYDWNYFRSYDGTVANRAYKDSSKDAYSVVMEPDPRILRSPPPGLEDIRQ